MTINMKDRRVRECWHKGHNWAYNFDNTKDGWIYGVCLRCRAEQYFFVDETNDTDVDADRTEEQTE